MQCPEWHKDFDQIPGVVGEHPAQYQPVIEKLWEELLEGPQNPVVIVTGKLVFIGTLEKLDDGVRVRIEIGQLNFIWEGKHREGEAPQPLPLQQEIEFGDD